MVEPEQVAGIVWTPGQDRTDEQQAEYNRAELEAFAECLAVRSALKENDRGE